MKYKKKLEIKLFYVPAFNIFTVGYFLKHYTLGKVTDFSSPSSRLLISLLLVLVSVNHGYHQKTKQNRKKHFKL